MEYTNIRRILHRFDNIYEIGQLLAKYKLSQLVLIQSCLTLRSHGL